ncbi:hypothetical protein NHQ30_002616 [Ciborinia camelliae]|nr:hypothetical protein NHQ30_002616 [Ciborinia camelliae]
MSEKWKERGCLDSEQSIYHSEDQIVIALDFGTTFSGIAYAFPNDDKPDIIPINDWPGLEGHKHPKVPTIISYDSQVGGFTWGAQKHTDQTIQGIKLLLDPGQVMPSYVPTSNQKADLARLGKPAVDVAADYICAMYKHAVVQIKSRIPAEYFEMCQKQFVLSVPAVWSDKAKDLTQRAAKQAGIWPVSLIKEPEAAAMYTLHALKEKALVVGDAFVICDAGGGTVDLISYEITQLKPKLKLKELVPGSGCMAGSLYLNKRFEEAVANLVGVRQFDQLKRTLGFRKAVQQFDLSVKTAFRGVEEEDYFVNFPMAKLQDDEENNLSSNCWNMKCDDLKLIFDPLIADIKSKVDEQVNTVKLKRIRDHHPKADEIKAIFLVGGFGSSAYLKSQLEEHHSDIQVLQPHDAWSAIVKGAVLSRLPRKAMVVSTQATRHYGVLANSNYDDDEDRGQPKTRDPYYGEWMMTWYINRGDDLERSQKLLFSFFRTLDDLYNDSLIFATDLQQCESIVAPVYPDTSIKTNCTLTVDLTGVDRTNFKQNVGMNGKPCWDVHFDLVVTIMPAVMKFSLEIKGKEMGSVVAKYD